MKKIGRQDLFKLFSDGCQTPGCKCDEALYSFHCNPSCHPGSPTFTILKRNGTLDVECAECSLLVANVVIGDIENYNYSRDTGGDGDKA